MDIKSYFQITPYFDLTAAQIGISKWNWVSIKSKDENAARKIMQSNRFDVLPIVEPTGSVSEFFCTRDWSNYESLNLLKIEDDSKLYYRTSLLDLVKKFSEKQRYYFFLSDHNSILGLVSLVNLNDPLVYNYLYQVLADIERKFSQILKKSSVTEEMIFDYFSTAKDKYLNDLAKDYSNLKKNGMEITIYDRMYFQTVGATFSHFLHEIDNDYKKFKKYAVKMSANGPYNTIRNNIMHPINTLISSPASLPGLHDLLVDYEIIRSIEV